MKIGTLRGEQQDETGFLSALIVLDLADEKASFCSRILADLGAKVIKIECPEGDSARKTGSYTLASDQGRKSSLSFLYSNANKFGITLNLEHEIGVSIFRQFLEKCDVLIDTFTPDSAKRRGLDHATLSAVNSKLIQASVTGFGQTGPRKDDKSSDLIAAAFGGQMYGTGTQDAPPLKAFGGQPYFSASLYAAIAILLALRQREQTGFGKFIDLSLQESVASNLGNVLVHYFSEQGVPRRHGSRHLGDDFTVLSCRDGFLHVSLFQKWETLIEWLESEDMAEDLGDEKWLDQDFRRQNADHVIEVLTKWTKSHTVAELFQLAQLMRFPWAPVQTPSDIIKCPHLQERHFFEVMETAEPERQVLTPGLPFKTSLFSRPPMSPAPAPGEHNKLIYTEELGFSDAYLNDLYRNRII